MNVRMLCAAMMAVVVGLAALAGAGGASAAGTLCFVDSSPCPGASVVPTGTAVVADSACYNAACNAGSEAEKVVIGGNVLGLVTCVTNAAEDTVGGEASVLSGSVVVNGGGTPEVAFSSLSFSHCTNGFSSCSVMSVLPAGGMLVLVLNRFTTSSNPVGSASWSWSATPGLQASCAGTTCGYWGGMTQVYDPNLSGAPDTRAGVDDASQTQVYANRASLSSNCGDSPVMSGDWALHQDNVAKTNIYLTQ